ncbi:MAG: FG-GAP-like repeat-containing protein, partial [Verrucomicrobiota bacterium]
MRKDLSIANIDTSGLIIDGQGPGVGGSVSATVTNLGSEDVTQPFTVLFFDDLNGNALFDPGVDTELGSTLMTDPLAAHASALVTAPLTGPIRFAGSPLRAFVDRDDVIDEGNEENNIAGTDLQCTFVPPAGAFAPAVEFVKDTFDVLPDHREVIMTPVVIDLDGDGHSEIVFNAYRNVISGWTFDGALRAISGVDGSEVWTVTNTAYETYGGAGVAVGDIDLDGRPEIITIDDLRGVIAFEHDGTFKWRTPSLASYIGFAQFNAQPSIADLDRDGVPEIVVGATALDNTGAILWQHAFSNDEGTGQNVTLGAVSLVADLDLDGNPEVLAGRSAYRSNGDAYWHAPVTDGYTAVGNFDADLFPEIVLVTLNEVYLLEHTGDIIRGPFAIPNGGEGGPPTIADLDGDGEPEIGVAGRSRYVVFETDGVLKWDSPISDGSSRRTGSSVFDFEGDGAAEVVYGDQNFLRIFRGSDGAVLYELAKSSGTVFEYPVVADVDGDGNAEIVTGANGTQKGIFVIGDGNDNWVSTRSIWNQYAYSINNIEDDGTVPALVEPSWLDHNTYRLNRLAGNALGSADLIPSFVRIVDQGATAIVTARIGNSGVSLIPPGVNISFFEGHPGAGGRYLGTEPTIGPIPGGGFEDVQITIAVPTIGLSDIRVAADQNRFGIGWINECNEANNIYASGTGVPRKDLRITDIDAGGLDYDGQ